MWYFLSKQAGRIGVGFFFIVSGYYYLKALMDGNDIFKKYFLKLLKTYIFWSIVYVPINIYSYLLEGKGVIDIIKSLLGCFFIFGSYYHFWFFISLIFSVVIVTLFYKWKKLNLLGLLTIPLYVFYVLVQMKDYINIEVFNRICNIPYFLVIERLFLFGLPLFMLGYWLYLFQEKLMKIDKKKTLFVTILLAILVFSFKMKDVSEMTLGYFAYCTSMRLLTPILLIFIMVSCFHFPMPKLKVHIAKIKSAATIMYYTHPAILFIVSIQWKELSPLFLLMVCITINAILGSLLSKYNGKWSRIIL